MAIRRSLSVDVAQLVAQLTSGSDVERETAGARLSVIGTRAAGSLARVADDPSVPPEARATAFRALAAMNDRRAPPLARAILRRLSTDPGAEPAAVEAIEVLSASALSRSTSATEDFEQLTESALDARLGDDLRLAAIRALKRHARATVGPILDALSQDRRTAIAAEASSVADGSDPPRTQSLDLGAILETGRADEALTAVASLSSDTPVTILRRHVDRARDREKLAPEEGRQWRAVRGELHRALAHQGSRLAVYDLREAFDEATAPLPVGFVAAAAEIGDASCLEPLVRAWLAGTGEAHGSWRDHLASAFGAIVGREGLTRQHAVLRRILEKWPAAGSLVALAPKRLVSTTSRTRP